LKSAICIKREFRGKGQFNVEYFVVLTVFLMISVYFAFRLLEFYPEYLKNVKEEILRSDAYRLSEMLVNDDGEPSGWTVLPTDSIKRIGLSHSLYNQSNLLDTAKMAALENKCRTEYSKVRSLVGAAHDFYITTESTDGTVYNCGSLPAAESIAVIRRVFAFQDGDYGKMTLYMWW
jgi:hypothetical protein